MVRFSSLTEDYVTTYADAKYCFATEEELHAALDAESKANIAEYKDGIQDVNSLVQFLIDHVEDSDIKAAAEQKAGELLGNGRNLENFADAVNALGENNQLEL